ncbi:MAG: hypothetical protein U5R48_14515 [Gammaproteobacteria bacterium]|nr:hypothetical protein [Gammaproteobacteria bacterium]
MRRAYRLPGAGGNGSGGRRTTGASHRVLHFEAQGPARPPGVQVFQEHRIAPGAGAVGEGRGVGADPHARLVPERVVGGQRLGFEHVEDGVARTTGLQGGGQGTGVDDAAAGDVHQHRAGLHAAEQIGIHQMGVVVIGGGADHQYVRLGQFRLERIGAHHAQGMGIRLRSAPDAHDLGAEGPGALGHVAADAAVAEDQPAAAVELAELQPLPGVLRLGTPALLDGLEAGQYLGHHEFGDGDAAGVVDGQPDAGIQQLAEGGVLEARRRRLHPLDRRRGEQLLREVAQGCPGVEEQFPGEPAGLGRGVVGRRAVGPLQATVVFHDHRLHVGPLRQLGADSLVAVAKDQQFHVDSGQRSDAADAATSRR